MSQPPASAPTTNPALSIVVQIAFAAAICCGEAASWGSSAACAGL